MGTGWAIAIQLLCVPFYIRLMGVEAYGLVGFYLVLLATLQVLDFGLTPTLNRELARLSALSDQSRIMRDFARTLEVFYWSVGALLGVTVAVLAPVLATRWVNPGSLGQDEVRNTIAVMGVLVGLQWPLSLYQGGLLGLQRQTHLNVLRASMATLSGVGAVIVLALNSPRVTTFFAWQAAVAVLHVASIAFVFWACMPKTNLPTRPNVSLVRRVTGFAAGMTGIAFFAMVLVQMDKAVLSKLVSLQSFGYYVLAGTAANGLQLFIMPIFTAAFPRLSGLCAAGAESEVRSLYHDCSQLMTVLVVPVAAVLALFSSEILTMWTGQVETAKQAAPLLSILVVGTAVNGLMHLPYAVQLAYGWTSIGLALTITQVVVFLPLLVWAATAHGAIGAAWVWALLNVAYLTIGLPWTHRRLLRGEAAEWIISDVAAPAIAAIAVVCAGRALAPQTMAPTVQLGYVSFLAATGMAAAVLLAPRVRNGFSRVLGHLTRTDAS